LYKVLLVDDEPLAIEGLQMFMEWEKYGFQVAGVCENGADALEAARRFSPDVVVTDIRMPEMDGLELIDRLREAGDWVPEFVVLSAYGEFPYVKRAMQLGVLQFLLKPIVEEEAAEVLMRIRERLDTRRDARRTAGGGGEASIPALAARRMKDVLLAIEDADASRTADLIDDLFREMDGSPPEWAEMFAGSLAVHCGKLIRGTGGDPAAWTPTASHMEPRASVKEPASVQAHILSFTEQAIEAVRALRKRKPSGTMVEVDRYVREHYRSPLSIRDVAARFYLNPVYLGKAYQYNFGCGLLDRMHDLRIAEACEKLRGTTESIVAIAEQVGYAHYHHFLQHFERRMGRKPAEYRNSIG